MRLLPRYWRGEDGSQQQSCTQDDEQQQTHSITLIINNTNMELTTLQLDSLKELRRRVTGVAPDDFLEDCQLIKWLVARSYNVDKAESMLRKSLEWRDEWEVSTVGEWDPPEVLKNYYPAGLAGHDIEGCPLLIVPYGNCDTRGLLQSSTHSDYIKYTIQFLEASKRDMVQQTKILGKKITQQVAIFDLEHFSMKHILWKPAMDVILQLVQLYEANYPELLKCAYVVNASKVFTIAYATIKPFLNEVTIQKIQIYGTTGWKEKLQIAIDPEVLPKYYGGNKVDPDGNPKCPSLVCPGGEVPKSYYLKNKPKDHPDGGAIAASTSSSSSRQTSLTIAKGTKETLSFKVTQSNSQLRWEFQSEDYDLGFGVSRQVNDGEDEVLMPIERVNSQIASQQGVVTCTEPGTYIVTFDNTFSYFTSKKVLHHIEIIPPA